MVQASMIEFPQDLACGIETCGISDFITFLESTAVSRRKVG